MKKCPACGTIVQEEDKCSVCGTDLFETRSEPLEELVKEEAARPRNEDDPHWKRNALLPPLVLTGLGVGLILSGFLLILYSPAPLSFVRWYGGLVLVVIGFYVVLFMVIGGRESEVRGGMREEEAEITNQISMPKDCDVNHSCLASIFQGPKKLQHGSIRPYSFASGSVPLILPSRSATPGPTRIIAPKITIIAPM